MSECVILLVLQDDYVLFQNVLTDVLLRTTTVRGRWPWVNPPVWIV